MHSCNDRIVLEHCAVSLGCMAADDANRRFFCNNGLLQELFSVATSAFKAGQSCLLTCVYFAVLRMIEMEPNAREIYRTLRFVKLLLATVGTIDESHYARSLAVSIISCLIENEKNAEWTSVSRERGRFAELLLKYLEQDLELHRVRELERVRDGQVPATVAGSTGNALISWERIQLVRALFTSGAVEGDKEKSILRYLGLMLRADQSVGERSFAAKCVARLALLPRYSSCLHSHRGLLRDLHGLATQEVVAHNKNEIEVALAALVNASRRFVSVGGTIRTRSQLIIQALLHPALKHKKSLRHLEWSQSYVSLMGKSTQVSMQRGPTARHLYSISPEIHAM